MTWRLRGILKEAIEHVPRYRRLESLLSDLEGGWEEVMSVLKSFPVVSREEVASEPASFRSDRFSSGLSRTRTSGTTGTPLETWVEPFVVRTTDALAWRRTVWAGWTAGDWMARLVGDPVIPLHEKHPKRVGVISYPDRRIYLSAYHLDAEYASMVARLLSERRPAFLMGYPSALGSLFALAGEELRGGGWEPTAILYSSEPLLSHQEAAIRSVSPAPIRGYYGCAERCVSAAECEHGSYHLSLLDGYVEGTLEDEPATQGPLVTGLLNRAMPLIRYRLGDQVKPVQAACSCGRTLPRIERVVTKREDSLVTPSGREISPSVLTWAFKDLRGLTGSQVAQTGPDRVEVRVVCRPEDLRGIREVVEARLAEMLFGEMRVNVVSRDQLELTVAGKTRFSVKEWEQG